MAASQLRIDSLLKERNEILNDIEDVTSSLQKLNSKDALAYIKAYLGEREKVNGEDEDNEKEKAIDNNTKNSDNVGIKYQALPWVIKNLIYRETKELDHIYKYRGRWDEIVTSLDLKKVGWFSESRLRQLIQDISQHDKDATESRPFWKTRLDIYKFKILERLCRYRSMWKSNWSGKSDMCNIDLRFEIGKSLDDNNTQTIWEVNMEKLPSQEEAFEFMLDYGSTSVKPNRPESCLIVEVFMKCTEQEVPEFMRNLREYVDVILKQELLDYIPGYMGYVVSRGEPENIINFVVFSGASPTEMWNSFNMCFVPKMKKKKRNRGTNEILEEFNLKLCIQPALESVITSDHFRFRSAHCNLHARYNRAAAEVYGITRSMNSLKSSINYEEAPETIENFLYGIFQSFEEDIPRKTRRDVILERLFNKIKSRTVEVSKITILTGIYLVKATKMET